MECLTFCIADSLELSSLEKGLKAKSLLNITRYWNVIEAYNREKNQYCYFFKNGTVVLWNIKRYEFIQYLTIVKKYTLKPLENLIHDEFSYRIADKTAIFPHDYFHVDSITLESDEAKLKLAISYGLSQSIKLNYYEQRLENSIMKYTHLVEQLSLSGKTKLSRNRINKILGDILFTKSELNLTENFLYQPKFYWQHPNLEQYYEIIANYLDITKRAETINSRLNTLNEIFEMFNGYLQNRHSHILEVVIIVLIVAEIVFSILNLHLTL